MNLVAVGKSAWSAGITKTRGSRRAGSRKTWVYCAIVRPPPPRPPPRPPPCGASGVSPAGGAAAC